MVDRLVHSEANARRIAIVESCFGASGQSLAKPGRVLVGEGVLTKCCRKKAKPRQFFLFNDMMMYGSIVISKKKYSRQHIQPLEDVKIVPLEDDGPWKNGWQIISPRKSYSVFAASPTEKVEWMAHIQKCINDLLAKTDKQPATEHAAVWVKDSDAAVCMHCRKAKFTAINRRHHCRKCGSVVCGGCSTQRFLLPQIAPKPLRVCDKCYDMLTTQASKEEPGAQALPPTTFATELNKTGTRHREADKMARYGSSDDEDDEETAAEVPERSSFYSTAHDRNGSGEENEYSEIY